jgi:hypothetical protein
VIGAHICFPSIHGFILCRQNGGAMVVSAHYFFPSFSWFCFCVGNTNHHHGVAIIGGHNFLSCLSFSFV